LDDMLSIAYGQDLNLGSEYLYFLAAHEAQLLGLEEIQMKYAREAIDKYNALERKNEVMLGRSYYILEDFDMAKSLFESLLKKRPNHIFSLSKLASIAFMAGDDKLAYSFISKIRENKNEYDFGYSSYFIAQAYAQGKKYTEAFKILGEAVKEGDVLSAIDYENDPLFKEMHAMPQWVSIVNYWSDQYRN
ncbi:MAG: hypothetical protein KJP00_06170, partial [Bacteroidia bacterium]|nr:hypothetical protein [Bacteroidia bacterium]